MQEVSVVIPNFNGMAYLDGVLSSLERQTIRNFEVILVDNGSTDGSCAFVSAEYPWVHMIQLHDHDKMDDAGNYYCALGWAFARGKDKDINHYDKEQKIFSACAGAAIYRKKIIDRIGDFDEEHFAYLEDLDIGYRARIFGYQNWYAPKAKVYHVGSGTSGSRYNQFKIRYSSRNNIYLIYKNMPFLQIVLNLPFLLVGFGAKILFFASKGFGREYLAGIKNGFQISRKNRKVKFSMRNFPRYIQLQVELWINIFRRFAG